MKQERELKPSFRVTEIGYLYVCNALYSWSGGGGTALTGGKKPRWGMEP